MLESWWAACDLIHKILLVGNEKKLEDSSSNFIQSDYSDSFIFISDAKLILHFVTKFRLAYLSFFFSLSSLVHQLVYYMKSNKATRSKMVEVQHMVDVIKERAKELERAKEMA